MAAFDFIDSAVRGYKFVWQARTFFLRLAALPFLVKLGSFFLLTLLDLEGNYLRQGLILIPACFAEGWLVAQGIRFALLGEHWPVLLSGDRAKDIALLGARARSISAAIIFYVLTRLVLSFLSGLIFMSQDLTAPAPPPEPAPGTFLAGLAAMAVAIWAFRFLWLYVPAALGYPVTDFTRRIRGYNVSFCMIGTWLLCFVPPALVFLVAAQILAALFPAASAEPAQAYACSIIVLQAAIETIVALISSLGIAYGVQALYRDPDQGGKFS